MSRSVYDVVVIGAGPAGALAARGLAQRGHHVLLVDKQRFPRPKVCGCCLNRYALANLEQVGLGDLVARLDAPTLRHLEMVAGGKRARIALPAGVSLSREAMDSALIDEARHAGADFRQGLSAKMKCPRDRSSGSHTVDLHDDESVAAKVVVVADGLGGTSLRNLPGFEVRTQAASRIGFGGSAPSISVGQHSVVPEGGILMACGKHGYLGAVRLEDGRIDLAAAVDAAAVKSAGGWAGLAEQLLVESGLPRDALPIDAVERWRATPALTRRRARLAGPGIFVVGDAAGYVEPFTGEGMAWAMAGGVAVVPIAGQAVAGWKTEQEQAWQDVFTRQVRRRQAGCRLVAATLRRPWLTRSAVRLLATAPAFAGPLVRHITRPGKRQADPSIAAPGSDWAACPGTAV